MNDYIASIFITRGESGLDWACESAISRAQVARKPRLVSFSHIVPSKEQVGLVVGRRPEAAEVADGAILAAVQDLRAWRPLGSLSVHHSISHLNLTTDDKFVLVKRNPKSKHEFNLCLGLAMHWRTYLLFGQKECTGRTVRPCSTIYSSKILFYIVYCIIYECSLNMDM